MRAFPPKNQPSNGGVLEHLARQEWFLALEHYGQGNSDAPANSPPPPAAGGGEGSGSRGSTTEENADAELIPRLVEAVVLPRAQAWIDGGGWDPFSRASTGAAVSCVSEILEVFVSADKPAMQSLLAAVLNRLQVCARSSFLQSVG